ncbi:MAG: hypothetical protein FWG68_05875 [Defluviitaleaceae bacterium]|nr:hypothetical protein [Defluviitaleaceae bacterium]
MIQQAILELEKLGRMSSENLGKFDELLDKCDSPVSLEDAEILVKLFPSEGCEGVEWSLLHLLETAVVDDGVYQNLIDLCPSAEWREILRVRHENYKKTKKFDFRPRGVYNGFNE